MIKSSKFIFQYFFSFKNIILLLFFFTFSSYGQNSITKCDLPVEQSEINTCNPDSIEILYVNNSSIFLKEVEGCINIRVLILSETSIESFPLFFKKFKKLEKVIFENIKIVPKNMEYIPNLSTVSLIRIKDVKFPETFFDSLTLKLVKIHKCKNIYLNNVQSDGLFCYGLDVTWNRNTKFQFTSKKLGLVDVNFLLMDKWLKNPNLEEVNISYSINVEITNSFYLKFPQLKLLNIEL